MAVELIGFRNFNEQIAVQEASSAGLISMEHLTRTVSNQNQQVINRTGHARFRRGPVQPQSQFPASTSIQWSNQASGSNQPNNQDFVSPPTQTLDLFSVSPASPADRAPAAAAQPLALDFSKVSGSFVKDKSEVIGKDVLSLSTAVSTSGNSSSTFASTITGEGSVSNGKTGSASMFLAPAISSGKPPLSGKRCREHDRSDNISGKTSASSLCHKELDLVSVALSSDKGTSESSEQIHKRDKYMNWKKEEATYWDKQPPTRDNVKNTYVEGRNQKP